MAKVVYNASIPKVKFSFAQGPSNTHEHPKQPCVTWHMITFLKHVSLHSKYLFSPICTFSNTLKHFSLHAF